MLEMLEYKNNELFFENVNLNEIAKQFKTPIYIYSKNKIISNYKLYEDNFKLNSINNYNICYAVKANDNLSILKLLASLKSGADTVSGNEIEKALIAGILPEKIVFSGVAKTTDELKYAIQNSIGQINIESKEEFLNIIQITKDLNKTANISIRINPNIDAETHEKITTGKKENKFGLDLETVEEIIKLSKGNKLLSLKGLSVHIGSQITKLDKFEETFKFLLEIYENHPEFTTIDLGGGLGIQYREDDLIPSYEKFAKLIAKYFNSKPLKIIVEPGRSIVGDTGIFLTKVVYIKKTKTKNFAIIDGGMNNLIRPAMYDAYHHPLLLNILNNSKEIYDIVGPICESGDVFVKNIEMTTIKSGDCIAFLSAGAYGRSMASNYNLHNIAGELMIDNTSINVIRREINFKDLLEFEKND